MINRRYSAEFLKQEEVKQAEDGDKLLRQYSFKKVAGITVHHALEYEVQNVMLLQKRQTSHEFVRMWGLVGL